LPVRRESDLTFFQIARKQGFCTFRFLDNDTISPTPPWRYGTAQIIKAVRIAGALGIKHVITSEGDPKTEFGKKLTSSQAVLTIAEKLYEPLRLAADMDIKILIEPHGHITDSVIYTEHVLN